MRKTFLIKKKGFTLIELLAVIVILAIILLIAMPIVLNVIGESRKGAFEASAMGLVKTAENECMAEMVKGVVSLKEIEFGDWQVISEDKLNFSGKGALGGNIYVNGQCEVAMAIHNGDWCIKKEYNEKETVTTPYDGECGLVNEESFTVTYNFPKIGISETITVAAGEDVLEPSFSLPETYYIPNQPSYVITDYSIPGVEIFKANGNLNTGTIQTWIVPETGTYEIVAYGAQGGGSGGGYGAKMSGEFELNEGDVIEILVGQQGEYSGGGGGSFVVYENASDESDIILIAGGGGGSSNEDNTPFEWMHGHTGPDGQNAQNHGGVGGTNGAGGAASSEEGAGGGGFSTDGGTVDDNIGGLSFLNGGTGGTGDSGAGGFGGGAGAYDSTGGGGGYSGGGGGAWTSGGPNGDSYNFGGGGGSYNNGNNQDNESGVKQGDGLVVIAKQNKLPNNVLDLLESIDNITGRITNVRGNISVGVNTWQYCPDGDGIVNGILTDARDSKTYRTAQIGDQCWMADNLAYTTVACLGETWRAYHASTNPYPSACLVNGGAGWDKDEVIYQWGAAMNGSSTPGAQGLCPTGWHIPTDGEWTTLTNYVGFPAGTRLRASLTNWERTDNHGFSALLSGRRWTLGSLHEVGSHGYWWSSSPSGTNVWFRYLYSRNSDVYRNTHSQAHGRSVRCVLGL